MNAVHYLLMMVDLDNPTKPYETRQVAKSPGPTARGGGSASQSACQGSVKLKAARSKRPSGSN